MCLVCFLLLPSHPAHFDVCSPTNVVFWLQEFKTDTLFDKIARRGHEVEHINHKNLGKTNDTLCITEVVLYIARANDPFFVKNFTIKPLLVTKEAFYYCFGTSTDTLGTDSTDSVEKQIGGK